MGDYVSQMIMSDLDVDKKKKLEPTWKGVDSEAGIPVWIYSKDQPKTVKKYWY